MIIIIEFQLYAWKVIVRAVSREWCVFLVDNIWTSTRGGWEEGQSHVDRGVKTRIFLWTS